MPTVLLVRHGRTTANASGVLAGWTPGIALDDTGRAQAEALGERLAPLPLTALVCSPLQRCQETAAALLAPRAGTPSLDTDDRLGEARMGEWTGKELKVLAKDPLWPAVQAHPSAVRFPGADGESFREMQNRAIDAVRDGDARARELGGEDAVWVAVSHADVLKAIVADALGMHLDAFQRIVIDPCSVTAIRYTSLRPFVLRLNDTGSLSGLAVTAGKTSRRKRTRPASSDAVPGGGAGA